MVMPDTQRSRNIAIARVSSSMPLSSSWMITGSKALSCNCPSDAAHVTVVSMPNIMKQHWFTHSGMTGFTLPGMMLLPACRAGTLRSSNPVCGPELSSRRSSAAFFRCMARFLTVCDVAMYPLISVMAATGSDAAVMGSPVMAARWRVAVVRNRRSAQMPVPMAVAPRFSVVSCGTTCSRARRSLFRKLANAWNS